METLHETIEAQLRRRATAPAVFWNDTALSFAALERDSAAVAARLAQRGVRGGDRVAVGLPNSPEHIATVLGVLRAGGVLVPLNPAYTADEAAYIVRDSAAALVVTHPQQAAALIDVGPPVVTELSEDAPTPGSRPQRSAEDPAVIIYTSGTTSAPKGAILSNRALCSNLATIAREWQWTDADRLLLTLPCFHLHGLALGIFGSLLVGSSIVLRPRFVAEEVTDLLSRNRCSMFFGVPTMYNRLVALDAATPWAGDLRCMRVWVSGSAPLTAATFERFEQRFGHKILERFGMSEGGFMIAAPYGGPRRPGVVGKPVPGIDVRLIDPDQADRGQLQFVTDGEPGEIAIRGPNLFSGYWNRPDDTRGAFVQDFFRSGDLAVTEPDGMIRVIGRRSVDIIKSRGFKISAVEIENCLQAHADVAEVAVVGVPDADQGEMVVAAVTLKPGCRADANMLRAYARAQLAPHKIPGRIVFVDEIPRAGPGKFKKRQLIDQLVAGS